METNLTTALFENFYGANNETQITNRVIETQTHDPFEDPGENLGRLDDYFKFLKSIIEDESDEKTNYTNGE